MVRIFFCVNNSDRLLRVFLFTYFPAVPRPGFPGEPRISETMTVLFYRPQSYYWRRAIRAAEAAGDAVALWQLASTLADEVDAHDAFIRENCGVFAFLDPHGATSPAEVCESLVQALARRKAFIRANGWWPPKGVWAPGECEAKEREGA